MKKNLSVLNVSCWFIVICTLFWIGPLPGHAQTCGSVSNSGFENNLAGWTNNGNTVIVTDVHSGTSAARTGTGQGGLNSGLIPIAAGQVTFSVWAKISGSPSWAGVGLDFLNSSGTELSEINLQITATSYTQRSVTQAVPTGATQARIWTWKSGSAGNLFLDDFCITIVDNQAPSAPSGLSSAAITQTSFTLAWAASSDNVGVTDYEVFRNGTSIGTSPISSFNVTGLTAGTSYAMTVRARDAAGNFSGQSAPLNVTTSSPPVASCGSVSNNGFESGLTGWDNNGNTTVSTDEHSGVSAAVTAGEGGLHYGTLIPVSPGQTVAFSVWGKVSGTASWAGVGIDYFDAAGNELAEVVFDVTGATYREYSSVGAAPPGATSINLWTWNSAASGSLFLDDFCLVVANDTQSPTVPAGLTASGVTLSGFTLTWNAASDNTDVTEYEIFQDGMSVGTSSVTSFDVTGLTASETYVMTVRARDAAGNWSAHSTPLNVTTTPSDPVPPSGRVNNIGINVVGGGGMDYNHDKPWADAMRSHRYWDDDNAQYDQNYWPLEDATVLVYHGLSTGNNHGTYKLYFNGSADVSASGATVQNMDYNETTNTSTADIIISNQANSELFISFTDTKRTAASATNTGITNVKLMRPVTPGSIQSYPPERVFTDQFLQAMSKFTTIRYMDWTSTNSCGDEIWNDRTEWTDARQSPPELPDREYGWQGRGASWESVIKMANETQTDAWICIPHKVDDNYVRNLALLFRDGNEHTAGLAPDLKLYVEYSNEVWNWGGAFTQTTWVRDAGVAYGHPLNFDGVNDSFTLGLRYKVMRTVQISEIFRDVFGDSQMMSRIRPILAWQKGYMDLTNRHFVFLDRYYNKRDVRSDWPDPHPANHYIWGGGGSTYFGVEGVPDINTIWNSGTMNPDAFHDEIRGDAIFAKAFGLQYVAYEGNTHPHYQGDEAVIAQANMDPRMKDEIKEHHYVFNNLDGDLLCYFNTTGTPFGLAPDNLDNLTTPKFLAIDELNTEEPQPVNDGPVPPFSRPGNSYDVLTWESPNPTGSGPRTYTANSEYYAGAYGFRVNATGTYSVQIEYSTTTPATLAAEINGKVESTFNLASSGGGVANTPAFSINCTADKLYVIRLVSISGAINVRFIKVNHAASSGTLAGTAPASEIKSSPNPIVSGEAISIFGLDKDVPALVQIIDLRGDVKQEVTLPGFSQMESVSTSGLPKGIYLLKVITHGKTFSQRLVIK